MIQLPNSCYCSEIKVLPKNWKSSKASINKDWILYYRFYDPSFKSDPRYKKGKLIRLKSMNSFKTLEERRLQALRLIELEFIKLKEDGYNPITGLYSAGQEVSTDIKPSTPFYQALVQAEAKMAKSKSTKRDMKSVLRFVSKASAELGLYNVPITNISRKHIKMVLNQIESNQEKESTHRFNKNRTYLMLLFKELVELEAVETNPVREISKKQRTIPIRRLLTQEERALINQHLKHNHHSFWLFTNIFFHSGSRLTEMMQLKRTDVDMVNKYFTVTIKKGNLIRKVLKPIKEVALPFWEQAIESAKESDYLFSEGLLPGIKPINTDQITKRWKIHVKNKLNIQADFYSLKHLHLDEIAGELSLEHAALMASHTSTNVTLKHYAVNEKQRQENRLRVISNVFA
jgi:integrase